MSFKHILEFLIALDKLKFDSIDIEISKVISQLIQISYYLLHQLNKVENEYNDEICQLEKSIEIQRLQLEQQQKTIDELENVYIKQREPCYLLEEKQINKQSKNINNIEYCIKQRQEQNKDQDEQLNLTKMKRNEKIISQKNNTFGKMNEKKTHKQLHNFEFIQWNEQEDENQKFNSLTYILDELEEFCKHEQKNQNDYFFCCDSFNSQECITSCCLEYKQLTDRKDEIINANQKKCQDKQHINNDPYVTFFKLICQCVKLDLNNIKIFNQETDFMYNILIQKKIPYNQWYKYIKKELQNYNQ